jgi:protein-L-isoaspartate(D-aspartate) O-methyltransferase
MFRPPLSPDFDGQRAEMVRRQLQGRDIVDPRVLDAMGEVPRHRFVPGTMRASAYDDGPLPIGLGQTISQPYIVALMTQCLGLAGDENVLEIGTGSGYQAAVLSKLCREVHSVERIAALAERARGSLADLSIGNVSVHVGDGTLGLPEFAPYDGIIVTAGAPAVAPPLLDQLAEGGRLVIPVGPHGMQRLELWRREGSRRRKEFVCHVTFVPLIGAHGWREDSGGG